MYENPLTLYELAKMRHQAFLARAEQNRLQVMIRNDQPARSRKYRLALELGAITLTMLMILVLAS